MYNQKSTSYEGVRELCSHKFNQRFLKCLAFCLTLLLTTSFQASAQTPTGFVFPSGTQFRIKNADATTSPFYFSGTNNYYLMYKPMPMVEDVLNDMVNLNQKVVRMWFFMDGTELHDGYNLQSSPGVFNEDAMKHIDEVVAAISARGLKVVPVFVNYWSDFGGMPQYAQWAGTSTESFFSNATCRQTYKNYVAKWINRVNTVTGVAYKNDPAIFSWQLINEARSTSTTVTDFVAWVKEMSDYIHGLDPQHMISVGDEGLFGYTYDQITQINSQRAAQGLYQITNDWPYAGRMGDWIATLQLPNISYGTLHNYATDNWSYTQAWGENWIKYHIEVANQNNKPCVMEEYDKAYSGAWTQSADQVRANLLSAYQTIIRDKGMAGDMTWMLVGRNYTNPVEPGYTMDNTAPVEQIWLYRVKWSDGHQYSRYDPYTGPVIRNHSQLMWNKNGSTSSNLPPTASAGPDQTVYDIDVNGSQAVTLNGSSSIDPDGTIVSYVWREGTTQLATGVTPTVTLNQGTHTIMLTVTDDKGNTGTDGVVITVALPFGAGCCGKNVIVGGTSYPYCCNATDDPDGDGWGWTGSQSCVVNGSAADPAKCGSTTSNSLTVSQSSLTFTSAAASQTVNVTSNVSWTTTDDQSWITVSPASGSNNATLTITLTANTGTTSRTGTVTVSGGGITKTVSITQSAPVVSSLTVSSSALTFTSAAGSKTVNVTSNVSWTTTDDQTWITVSPASGSNNATLTITLTANTGTTSRTGTVTVSGGGITKTVSVTQSAPVVNNLTVSSSALTFTSAAASQTVNVTSNVSWTTTDDQTWITVSPASGSNNATITISVVANTGTSRTGVVTVAGGGITKTINVTQAAASSTSNVALNKSVTVSSVESTSYAGSNAVDGNTSTRWASSMGSDPQWMYVDLGATQSVGRVKITWEAAYATSYQIQTSNDASTWTTIKTVTGNTGGVNDHTGLTGSGRYVRIYGTARVNSSWGYSIFELEVYNGTTTVVTNLASSKPTTASSTESTSLPSSYAVDGNTSTRWASAMGSDPQWIYVDLSSIQTFNRVKITWEAAYATSYQIQTSNDASTWTTIKTVTGNTGGVNDHTGLTGSGRYVRVYGTARINSSWGYSIYELEVYNMTSARSASVEIAGEDEGIKVIAFPNPASDQVTLKLSGKNVIGSRVELMNALGKPVKNEEVKAHEHVMDLSEVASGLYIISVYNQQQRSVIKIQKK